MKFRLLVSTLILLSIGSANASANAELEVTGVTTGYTNLKKDGYIDFSLVMPALSRKDLLNFDMFAVISSETDTIKILGREAEVPSNLSLPKQKESYFLPITISKPIYRMQVQAPGQYLMHGLHGRFNLKKVVNRLRDGESFFDVINDFSFLGTGQRTVEINDNLPNIDLDISANPLTETTKAKGPQFDGEVHEVVGISMAEVDGHFLPLDIKRLQPGENLEMKSTAGQQLSRLVYVKTVAPEKDEDQIFNDFIEELLYGVVPNADIEQTPLYKFTPPEIPGTQLASLGIYPSDHEMSAELLEFLSPIEVQKEKLNLIPPANKTVGIFPAGTLATLSRVEIIERGDLTIEKKIPVFEISDANWTNVLSIPDLSEVVDPSLNYVWDVMFLGTMDKNLQVNEKIDLGKVTHVSRSTAEYIH